MTAGVLLTFSFTYLLGFNLTYLFGLDIIDLLVSADGVPLTLGLMSKPCFYAPKSHTNKNEDQSLFTLLRSCRTINLIRP